MKLEEKQLKAMADWYGSIDVHDQQTYSERVENYATYSGGTKRYRLFAYIIDLLDKNKLPEVVPDEEFEKIQEPEFYRGVTDINHNASLLADYDYHKGDGTFARGIHAARVHSIAEHFAGRDDDSNESKSNSDIITFKIRGDAKEVHVGLISLLRHELMRYAEKKVITKVSLYKTVLTKKDYATVYFNGKKDKEVLQNLVTLKKFLRDTYNNNFELYLSIVSSDSIVALLLGFDVLQVIDGNYQCSILNRGKMVVSESEFKRITDASKNYKGGVINFDKKTDDEFLRE